MTERFVTDTCSIIHFFAKVFNTNQQDTGLSDRVNSIFQEALKSYSSNVRLSIPSIVFVEIYEKWITNEEINRQFHYEVFLPLKNSPNIEIKSIDREVIENVIKIKGNLENHDMHDKIILASAMMLECSLITRDSEIIKFNDEYKVIQEILY